MVNEVVAIDFFTTESKFGRAAIDNGVRGIEPAHNELMLHLVPEADVCFHIKGRRKMNGVRFYGHEHTFF
jgi:hypothetical protein